MTEINATAPGVKEIPPVDLIRVMKKMVLTPMNYDADEGIVYNGIKQADFIALIFTFYNKQK